MASDILTGESNPYAPPQAASAEYVPPLSTVEVRGRLRGPALGLLASAIWGIGVALFLGATVALEKVHQLPRFTEQDQQQVATYACMLVAFLWVSATIARGSLAMLAARDYFAARNAAILAVLPCGGAWLVGLPFGLWALCVLRDPRVRQEFRRRSPWLAQLRQSWTAASRPA
jgi:hypothetical protein